jgi:enoyl-CoA hydratase
MTQETVLVRERDGILVVTLNRPSARNAIDLDTAERIARAMDMLDARADLHVGVITGNGGNFSAGADLKALARGERAIVPGRGFAGLVEAPPAKPLIAAVEGYALGGGCEIALACDLVVAGTGARFGLPEVRRGLIANAGGLLRLPRQLPYRLALEMTLLGEPIEAEAAHHHGLVNRVVPTGDALDEAMALARKIAGNGPLAVRASKRIIRECASWPDQEAFGRQAEISRSVFESADAREGALAFAEKRAPLWRGC